MTLNLSVSAGDRRLLEQARQVAAANRAAQSEREQQRAAELKAARQIEDSPAERDGGPTARDLRQVKRPAAQRSASGLAHCWIRIPWSEPYFPASSVQVGCGDGTQWLDVSIDVSEVTGVPDTDQNDGYVNPAVIHLPSGGENSIIVLAQHAIKTGCASPGGPPPTSITYFEGQTREYLAFTVGRSRIRQITVPSALSAIIDAMMPTYTTTITGPFNNVLLVANKVNPGGRLFRQGNAEFRHVYFGLHDWARLDGPASPAVYQVLDDPTAAVNAFVAAGSSYASIRPFFTPAPPQKRIVQNVRPGEDITNNFFFYYGEPFYDYPDLQYLLNSGSDPATLTTNVTTGVPVKPYTLSPDRIEKPGFTAGNLRVAWDWGNPAYCRSRLGALGFTSADLVP